VLTCDLEGCLRDAPFGSARQDADAITAQRLQDVVQELRVERIAEARIAFLKRMVVRESRMLVV
jgi:hypothetical protein